MTVKRRCIDCSAPITRHSQTGRCHPCSYRAPEFHMAASRAGHIGNREGKSRGGRKVQATWGKTLEAREAFSRGAHNQSREAKARGARNQPREAKARGGRIGGPIGGPIGGRTQGRKNVESGLLARIAKGVPSTADGILFHSQTEASFYCVAQELGGEPTYEPAAIPLSDGRSYTPDFVLGRSVLDIPANVPIELKPARNAYYNGNFPKAIEAGAFVVYWNELVET